MGWPPWIAVVSPGGEMRTAATGLAGPNGMVINRDGRTLTVAEHDAGQLTTFDVSSD
jgi:sugar lactone lactonase YvrE